MTPLEQALIYAIKKNLPVFPVKGNKTPYTAHGHRDATLDVEQIERWWQKWPRAMIGVPTGKPSGLFVVDVDVKSHDGFATLKKLGLSLTDAPRSLTPSGGVHLFYKLNGQLLKNTAGKLGPGIDTRGIGGYIVMPGSEPSPGKCYAFVNDVDLADAPPVPEWLVKLLEVKPKPTPQEELIIECAKVAAAGVAARNDTLNKSAFRLAQIVGAGRLDEDEVRDKLREAALSIGLGESEINKTLDSAFNAGKASAKLKRGGKTQGHEIQFRDFDLWEEEVDGSELIDDIASHVHKHIAIGEPEALTIAAWTLHAHLVLVFEHSPRLNITSPVRRCGKTTLLRVIGAMVPKPLRAENVTSAVVYRVIDSHQPTLLLDEFDSSAQENMELRSILNAGHGRSDGAIRLSGDDFEPRSFKVFAATALCGIGRIPETLRDRSIIVRLRRRARNESLVRFHSLKHEHLTDLGRKAARWAKDNKAKVRDCDPVLPSSLHDRAADNWRSLLQIAEVCGESCRLKLWQAAVAAAGEEDGEDAGILMLADVRQIFLDQQAANFPDADKIASALLVAKLVALDERPWQAWGRAKKPLSQNNLSRILRTFEIASKKIRIGSLTPRGYEQAQFEDALERYL